MPGCSIIFSNRKDCWMPITGGPSRCSTSSKKRMGGYGPKEIFTARRCFPKGDRPGSMKWTCCCRQSNRVAYQKQEKSALFVTNAIIRHMMKMRILTLLFLLLSSFTVYAQKPYFVDGYHGGVYGHYPMWVTQFMVDKLAAHPEWKLGLEIEPETWD